MAPACSRSLLLDALRRRAVRGLGLLSSQTWTRRSVFLNGKRLLSAANLFLYLQASLLQSSHAFGVFGLLANLLLRFTPSAGFFLLPGSLHGV